MPGTVSAKVLGLTATGVNSRHHQCIKDIAPELKITAWSPDSVPEMMEGYPRYPILAVQSRFFGFLIEEAKKYHQKRVARPVSKRSNKGKK